MEPVLVANPPPRGDVPHTEFVALLQCEWRSAQERVVRDPVENGRAGVLLEAAALAVIGGQSAEDEVRDTFGALPSLVVDVRLGAVLDDREHVGAAVVER